jgi:hypothetical protein
MKTLAFSTFLALTLSPVLLAAPSKSVGMLPGDKVFLTVEETERNPFGQRIIQAAEAPKDTGGEESQIRSVVENLTVKGVTKSGGRMKVLLGSYALEEGKLMPPLIPDQTEKLRVLVLTDKKVELGFIEKDGSAQTRKIVLHLDFTPAVRYKVGPGATASSTAPSLGGVYKKNAPATPRE